MSEKRAREEQTDITLFLNKKPMTSLVAEPTTLFVEQTELIELPIPERQSIQELPNPMPKAESGHSIQKAWFEEFSWLKLAENAKSLYCISCHWAFEQRRLKPADMITCTHTSFPWKEHVSGWSNFKKGRDGIRKHNESGIHRNAEFAINLARNAAKHKVLLDAGTNSEFELNRMGLRAVFESIRLCGHQGLALRGHRDENNTANLNCIVNLIGKFNIMVNQYLTAESKMKYLSPGIQNEVLKSLGHSLQRNLINRIQTESVGFNKEPVFSIILDETTDINRKEQVSFCIRFCNADMQSEEVFLGFHLTSRTNADSLLHLVKTSLLSFGLPFTGIRGQGYDGASNMSGKNNGLQAKVTAENPKALYLYCLGHQLNLVVQDSFASIPQVMISLERMNAVVHFIKNSPKKLDRFQTMMNEIENRGDTPQDKHLLRPLCPTRWVMRLPAVEAFLIHYAAILEFLEAIVNDRSEPGKNRGEAESYLHGLESFQNYFNLRVIQRLLQVVHPIHVECQGRKATTGEVSSWINTLILTLTADGQNKENAEALYESVKTVTIQELRLDLPKLPRANRIARSSGTVGAALQVTEEQIRTFYTALYSLVMETGAKALLDRYSKNDLDVVELLRRGLEDNCMADSELNTLAKFYAGEIKLDNLRFERNIWFTRCKGMQDQHTIATLREKLVEENALKIMIPNMHMLCVIYVCLPVTTCEAERSFSMLRRIHTFMRNSQSQERLNHCSILAIHRELTHSMEIDPLIEEFIDSTAQRRNKFGPNPE